MTTLLARAIVAFCLILAGAAHAQDAREVALRYAGLTLLGDLVVPKGKLADGPVILLAHGTLAHKDMELIEALQSALAERGLASLAHSLSLGLDRRRGMYDCAVPHRYRHEDALGEIAAWVDWLRAQGAREVVPLGHSRGGNQVAWYAAERADVAVSKVVLLAPATEASAPARAASYRARFGADLSSLLATAQALAADGKGKTVIDVPGILYCSGAEASAASLVSLYGPEPRRDTPLLIPRIARPALVIVGSADTVVPDIAERVRPLADGARVRLAVIEDAGHMFLDFYTEDVADLVVEFLAEPGG